MGVRATVAEGCSHLCESKADVVTRQVDRSRVISVLEMFGFFKFI